MIIKSYLVYPADGHLESLSNTLNGMPNCEVVPSTNENLLVLVTESEDETAEATLEAQLKKIPTIQSMALVSGHNESE